jgi:cytochrome c5
MRYALLAFVVVAAFGVSFARRHARETITLPGEPMERSSTQLYGRYCASCHGRDGAGKTSRGKLNHARNLIDAEWQDRVSDERIFNSIVNGKGKMPSYGKKLSEKEIDALVAYVRRLRK